MKLLEKLFGCGSKKDDIALDELLSGKEGKPSIVILTASCCNPLAIPGDNKIKNNIAGALTNLGIDTEIHLFTITSAQSSLNSLPDQHKELGNKVMGLFQSKGLGAFPALIINGELVFYGGIPEVEQIQEKLASLA
jgi:hypothetical protein